ncbi:MAG: hypothetical protein LBM38_03800 [Clostridiales bacterium]|jgi:hypothetical protein|nr:hypothetical protein [Clostridiales bacterium]
MKEISRDRFNVFVGFIRKPEVTDIAKEINWFQNDAGTLFATILFCLTDGDYNCLIFSRDADGRFKPIKIEIDFATADEATAWIEQKFCELEDANVSNLDATLKKKYDLFAVNKKYENRLHYYFEILRDKKSHVAAKTLISEIMPHFIDIDGNFIQQFQTDGFDQRLWELYLFCYFNDELINIDRSHNTPDFLLSKDDVEVALEAVTISRKTLRQDSQTPLDKLPTEEEMAKLLKNDMPVQYGRALINKLGHFVGGKHYWELEHTIGKPLVFAIADFHDDFAMTWSTPALCTYLYGYEYSHYHDKEGKLHVEPIKVDNHEQGGGQNTFPSGFFFQPGAENISAVLHSTSGTLSKFNRMGVQCGFGLPEIRMIRQVFVHNNDPNATVPIVEKYEVGEESNEKWAEGISVYHNPNAIHPLPFDFFPSAAHHIFEDESLKSYLPDRFVYSSQTCTILLKESDNE